MNGPAKRKPRSLIGWREWLALPSLGIPQVKAKVDTGARSSALHAFDVEIFQQDGCEMVRFKVHPFQRDLTNSVESVAPLHDRRKVRSSAGHESMRPVILADVELHGQRFAIELTLVRRDAMGFRMLLGRQAIRRRFRVEPARSYLGNPRPSRRRPTATDSKPPTADGADPRPPAATTEPRPTGKSA